MSYSPKCQLNFVALTSMKSIMNRIILCSESARLLIQTLIFTLVAVTGQVCGFAMTHQTVLRSLCKWHQFHPVTANNIEELLLE